MEKNEGKPMENPVTHCTCTICGRPFDQAPPVCPGCRKFLRTRGFLLSDSRLRFFLQLDVPELKKRFMGKKTRYKDETGRAIILNEDDAVEIANNIVIIARKLLGAK
jgi:hypothetical protein